METIENIPNDAEKNRRKDDWVNMYIAAFAFVCIDFSTYVIIEINVYPGEMKYVRPHRCFPISSDFHRSEPDRI